MAIENRDIEVEASSYITRRYQIILAERNESSGANRTERGKPETALSFRKALRGLKVEALADQFGAILYSGLQDRCKISRRRLRGVRCWFDKRKRALIRIAKSSGKIGKGCIEIVLRLNLKQLGLREIDICKADVQPGLQLIFRESGDLVRD